MDTNQQFDGWHRVYLLAAWRRGMYVILGAFLLGGGLFTSVLVTPRSSVVPSSIFTLFMVGAGVYTLSFGLRSRITLSGNRITVRGAFREQSADRSEIDGLRTYSDRSGTYTRLMLKSGGTINFLRGFETDGDFDTWMHAIPDLDLRDREGILDQIAREETFGATPGERKSALNYAIAWTVLLYVVAIVASVALNMGDDSLQAGAAVILALVPVIVIAFVWHQPLLYAVFRARRDPRSELGFVLMIAGFALLIRCRGIHMVDTQNILVGAAIIALVMAVALISSIHQGVAFWGRLIALFLSVGVYGYGVIAIADTLADHANPAYYSTMVTGKHLNRGKSTSYILELAPWGPVDKGNTISVSAREYHQTGLGDSVCFNLRPGLLHLPWYTRTDCNGQSSAVP
jgi:hypothetical protein